jgi:hypothetical protein
VKDGINQSLISSCSAGICRFCGGSVGRNILPDWLRVGTDIVGTGTFNGAFTLTGAVPEPGSLLLLVGAGLAALWSRRERSA